MRYFVLGAGLAGRELARVLRDQGHQVIGTTTTPEKVDALRASFDDVRVLRGSDRDAIRDALEGVDARHGRGLSLNCEHLVHTLLQVVRHRVESFAEQRIPRDARVVERLISTRRIGQDTGVHTGDHDGIGHGCR